MVPEYERTKRGRGRNQEWKTHFTFLPNAEMQQGQPQVAEHLIVGYPLPNVLCLTLNRPQQLNGEFPLFSPPFSQSDVLRLLAAMTDALEADLCAMLDWAEEEPSIYVIIITGKSGCDITESTPR